MYTYRACDLLSDVELADLPLRNVRFNLPFKGAPGTMTAELPLTTRRVLGMDWLGATEPVRTFVWVDRGGLLLAGFMLWTRGYNARTKRVQLQGANIWSYFAHRMLTSTIRFSGVTGDQHHIVRGLVLHAQEKPHGNVGLVVDSQDSTVMRVRYYPLTDLSTISGLVEALSDVARGPDFRLHVEYQGGARVKRLLLPPRARWTLGTTAAATGFVLAKPGLVKDYTWPEDGTQLATTTWGLGSGEGVSKYTHASSTPALLDAGYPLLEVAAHVQADTWTEVVEATDGVQAAHRQVVTLPTLTCQADGVLGKVWPGDAVQVQLQDERFPAGLDEPWRILDIAVAPPDRGVELVTLTLGAA